MKMRFLILIYVLTPISCQNSFIFLDILKDCQIFRPKTRILVPLRYYSASSESSWGVWLVGTWSSIHSGLTDQVKVGFLIYFFAQWTVRVMNLFIHFSSMSTSPPPSALGKRTLQLTLQNAEKEFQVIVVKQFHLFQQKTGKFKVC